MTPLGPFHLYEPLGMGAHATVYRAVHEPTGRPVAVKVLSTARRGAARTLEREVQAVAGLSHPGIVEVYDTGLVPDDAPEGMVPGSRWVALELASHGSLERRPPKHYATVQHVLLQVLGALAHAHARGVIHRDLKPANVLRSGRRLKLADFGLAWGAEQEGPKVAGTPAYMAPEQVLGQMDRIGPWTDLYAVGCMAWELTTGMPPFVGDVSEVMDQHQTDEAPLFRPRVDVPERFEDWVRRLLGKRTTPRGDSAALAAGALHRLGIRGSGKVVLDTAVELPDPQTWTESLSEWVSSPFDVTTEPLAEPGVDDPWLIPRPDWRLAERTRPPVWLLGASLGLFALRSPPLVGRFAERDQLWAAARDAALQKRPTVLAVHGEPGVGTAALGRWLALTLVEGGHGFVFEVEDAAPDDAWWGAVERRAQRGLVILWVDDADRDVLQAWVDRVGGVEEELPVLLLITTDEAVSGVPNVQLAPLPDEHIEQLCEEVAGVSPAVAAAIAARVGGRPADAVALLRALVRTGRLQHGPAGFEVPRGFDHLPATRAQRAAWEIAKVVAQQGRDLRPVAIAALLEGEVGHGTWRQLCEHCGVEPDPEAFAPLLSGGQVSWSGRWRFATSTVAEGVLAQLPQATLRPLAAILAGQLVQDDELTRLHPLRARLLLRADRAQEAMDVLVGMHPATVTDDLLATARAALARAPQPEHAPAVVWLELHTLRLVGRVHDGREAHRRAEARLDTLSGAARQLALPIVGTIARSAGDVPRALACYDEALITERSAYLLRVRELLLEELGRMAEAEASAHEAMERARATGDRITECALTNDLADWHRVHGRPAEAEAGFRACLAFPSAFAWPEIQTVARENLVLLLSERGDWEEATEEILRLVARVMEEGGGRVERLTVLATLCMCAAHTSRRRLLEDGLIRLESEPPWRIRGLRIEGLSYVVKAAEATEARTHRRRLLDVVRRAGPEAFELAVKMARHGHFGPS